MRIANDTITVAAAEAPISMAASYNSDPVWLAHIVNYAIQVVWTGTPDGTFTLQASNDKGLEDKTNGGWSSSGVTNWTTITGSNAATAGAAGNWMWDVENTGYRWVRIVYTRAASTGSTTSLRFNCKGV